MECNKFSSIDMIYLKLGDLCNFRCMYCFQGEIHDNIENENNIDKLSGPLLQYIKNILSERKNTPAIFRLAREQKLCLKFWGGEPLVYFNKIKNILEQLSPYRDEISFVISTNGKLLSEEVVKVCNDYDIEVVLSHDGPNTYLTRGEDMLNDKEFIKLFKMINNKHVYGVVSGYNQNIIEYQDYIRKILCNGHIKCTLGILKPSQRFLDKGLYTFNENSKSYLMNDVYQKMTNNGDCDGLFSLFSPIIYAIKKIKLNRFKFSTEDFRCAQLINIISVDLEGRIFLCANKDVLIGTIYDDREQLLSSLDKERDVLVNTVLTDCEKCEYLPLCRWSCYILPPSESKNHVCEYRKLMFDLSIKYLIHMKELSEDEIPNLFNSVRLKG